MMFFPEGSIDRLTVLVTESLRAILTRFQSLASCWGNFPVKDEGAMNFPYWNEGIVLFPDLPDPSALNLTSAHDYPFYRCRAETELEPVVTSGVQTEVLLSGIRDDKPMQNIFLPSK